VIGWRKRQGHSYNTWYIHTLAWIWRFQFSLSRWIDPKQTNYNIEIGWQRRKDDGDYGNPQFMWWINTRNLERKP
jgi:hypothetical protein